MYTEFQSEMSKSKIGIETYIRRMIEKDCFIHPGIIIEQIGVITLPESGHTILHSAIEHALKTKEVRHVETLLDLNYPMYFANKKGQSIIASLLKSHGKD